MNLIMLEWQADMYELRSAREEKRKVLAEGSSVPTENHALLQPECTHKAIPSRRLGAQKGELEHKRS